MGCFGISCLWRFGTFKWVIVEAAFTFLILQREDLECFGFDFYDIFIIIHTLGKSLKIPFTNLSCILLLLVFMLFHHLFHVTFT